MDDRPETETNPSLKTRSLVTGYDGKIIIPDMNISIPDGKISVIIGANGCGKSTLLKAFCRLGKIMGGEITLDGKNIQKWPARAFARRLGLLPQSPVVPEGISVTDLVSRGRYPYRQAMRGLTSEDYKAVEDAMHTMGVDTIADCNVDELSGGQRQRVWITLALAQQTGILFLDEPTTYLDISYQIEILELLVRLNREKGTTIVMVLHDINHASRYADWIFAMKDGTVLSQGPPEKIISEELIARVYNMKSVIVTDPVYHTPNVIPVGRPELL